MNLIVGLGNPGEKYTYNRHNTGFMFVDYLAKNVAYNPQAKEWIKDKYLFSDILQINEDLILAKPQTYMNKSGVAVGKLIKNWKLKIENLIVVHDDLDIPFGKFRIVRGYGPKLHNGLESIQNHLLSMDFLRVRIGVDARTPEKPVPGIDYVLQDFTREELELIPSIYRAIFKLLKSEHKVDIAI